jgi:hypothetical protein
MKHWLAFISALALAGWACNFPGGVPGVQETRCPEATSEPFWVEPVPETTDETTVIVEVVIGRGEEVVITTESGSFSATGDFGASQAAQVEVTLLPDTVHHLEVTAKVARTDTGGCEYGGYTLNTSVDKNGDPLVIAQGNAPSE